MKQKKDGSLALNKMYDTVWIEPGWVKGLDTGMGPDSWKRTEEIEIDLADLLHRFCIQWKRIAVCAVVSAVILGGYGWLKDRDVSDVSVSDASEEIELTETEEQSVADAVRLEYEVRRLEEYLDNSILMQLDPYHKIRFIMLYRIDHARRRDLPVITESYLNFVLNGSAADALIKSDSGWKMDKSCVAELISAYQKTFSSPYQIVADEAADSSLLSEALFYVEITGKDARAAKNMALNMQEVLEEHSAEIKEIAGSHRLTLISSAENMTADSGLQSQQHDKQASLSSSRTALRTMTDGFSEEQMAAYQQAVGEEGQWEEMEKESVPDDYSRAGLKFAFLGFWGGIFAYCGIFSCWYIFHDTVKSTEEMKRLYTFPFYGGILLTEKAGKNGMAMTGTRRDACERGKAQVLNRIRLACKNQGMDRLSAVSDFSFSEQERECLKSIAGRLREWGIDMAVAENAVTDSAVWDELAENRNVLMVCRMGTTTHRMIDDAMNFYLENGMTVAGAAAFLQRENG